MKISQLKEVIRTKVREATAVKLTGGAALTDPQISQKITQMRTTTGDQTIGTEKNPIKFVKETEEYTMERINKMSRNELIEFLGLSLEEGRNWGDRELQGAAREIVDNSAVMESGTGDQPISSMSRADLLKHFKLDPNTPEEELSTEYLRDAMSGLDEADYLDDDDAVHEGVDDEFTSFKDYDEVYEDMEDSPSDTDKYKLGEIEQNDGFRANVGSGHRGLSVKPHPMDPRLLIISQDNGQRVVVEIEDIPELLNVLRGLM